MFGNPFARKNGQSDTSPPQHFKESARNIIYQQLSPLIITQGAASVRSAPTQIQKHHVTFGVPRSLASSVFSSNKRSVRSAPSIYSSTTATIPEDSEPVSVTVEQLVNDIALHENHYSQVQNKTLAGKNVNLDEADDLQETYKISLGSQLLYQNVPESLIDWNLNVTRCKLILTQLPSVSSVPDFMYSNNFPQLIGDLANFCHIVLIQPHISDKELIYTLLSSDIYQEHNLDYQFKKSVAEISVKQSRLLQINSKKSNSTSPISNMEQSYLKINFKEIALRNYLVNLAAAATTAYEYKIKSDEIKKTMRQSNKKFKLSKEDKRTLWDNVRLEVFKRAGLE